MSVGISQSPYRPEQKGWTLIDDTTTTLERGERRLAFVMAVVLILCMINFGVLVGCLGAAWL